MPIDRTLRLLRLALGTLLIAAGVAVSPFPGPGGLLFGVPGLILVLRNSVWARRVFARWKRRWPRAGGMLDRAMRRQSALRRRARVKAALQID